MTTKALLIGETDSGKTQLLRRYADDQFSDSYVATVGIDFKAKTQALDDGRSFNLQLWDTAGHERYRSLTTAYYRGAAYFMICLDMSKTVAHNTPVLATFYNLVQTHASSAVVTVVGTKKDLTQQTTLAQLKTMAAVHGVGAGFVFETSAKTGDTNVVTAMKGILGATFPPPVSATLTRTKSKPSSPTLTLPASATKSLAPTASTSPSPSTSLSRPPTLTSNPTLTANPTRTTNPTLSPRPTSSRDPSSTPTRPRTLSAKPTPSMRLSDTVELLADGSSSSSSSASAAAAVAASSSSSSAASTKSSSSTASSSSFASSSSSAVPVKVVASASSSSSSEVSRPSSSSSSASASASVPPRPMSSKASSSVYSSSSSASSSALSSSAVASSSSSSDGVSETPAPIAGPDAGRGVGGRVAGGSGTSFASSGGGIALFTILGVACIVALVVAVVVLLIVKQRAAAKKAAGEDDGSSAGSELPSDTASPQSPQPNDPFDESNAVVGRPVSSAVFADSAADAATPVKPVAVVPGPVTHAAAKEPPQTTTKKAPPQKKTKPTAKSTTKRVRSPKPSREEV